MAGESVDFSSLAQLLGGASSAVTAPIVVWLFVTGRIVRGSELEKKDAALERKDEQIKTLTQGLLEETIPALTRATDLVKEATPLIQAALLTSRRDQ